MLIIIKNIYGLIIQLVSLMTLHSTIWNIFFICLTPRVRRTIISALLLSIRCTPQNLVQLWKNPQMWCFLVHELWQCNSLFVNKIYGHVCQRLKVKGKHYGNGNVQTFNEFRNCLNQSVHRNSHVEWFSKNTADNTSWTAGLRNKLKSRLLPFSVICVHCQHAFWFCLPPSANVAICWYNDKASLFPDLAGVANSEILEHACSKRIVLK